MSLGTPLGAKAAGYFAEDDAGPQRPFAIVVGGGDIATGDEKEEIAPRHLRMPWASFRPASVVGVAASSRSSRRSRSARYWSEGAVLEIGATLAGAEQRVTAETCGSLEAKPVSPLSIAYCRIAQQMGRARSCRSSACRPAPRNGQRPRPSGLASPWKSSSTAAPRLSTIRW